MSKKKKKEIHQLISHEWECSNCNQIFEDLLPFGTLKKRKKCPACGKFKLCPNYSTNIIAYPSISEAKTFGQLSDINTRNKSKELIQKEMEDDPMIGAKIKQKQEKLPWWRAGKIPGTQRMEKPLDLSRVKDVNKFIDTGETGN